MAVSGKPAGGGAYTCPMHPEVRQRSPGSCPRCGMPLQPAGRGTKPMGHNMFAMGHKMCPWVQIPLFLLGGWLLAAPLFATYSTPWLAISDAASGALILVFAFLGLHPRRYWADLANTAIGVWLLFAPLVFWAQTPYEYANDTLVGALVIAFALLIPMSMPMGGGDVPPGWSYNPSTWQQRAPIVALAVASFLMARHMTAYQLGHTDWVFEPFFGDGSHQVLTSDVSQWWPVSDAGLGALVYLVEILSTVMGDARRWRTMPWMVAIFGFAVVPLGITSIVLVILQPVSVGAWCTLCLASAALMLLMIPLALDEVAAMLQFLRQSQQAGQPMLRTFFLGGESHAASVSTETRPRYWAPKSMLWGITIPLDLVATTFLGIWTMVAPDVLGSSGSTADNARIVGALVTTVAVVAMADVARSTQALNLMAGAWIVVAPWILDGATTPSRIGDALVGLGIVALSLRGFRIREHYGGLSRRIRFARTKRITVRGAAPRRRRRRRPRPPSRRLAWSAKGFGRGGGWRTRTRLRLGRTRPGSPDWAPTKVQGGLPQRRLPQGRRRIRSQAERAGRCRPRSGW